eukprot:CAMPEP_0194225958 /NCGR_PEP_ID=MMETSP0156-20130528/40796_1 /TAXON_ID=33649 /ORGANISM="Thalassionema nitzschioides, Strain L26-B" /LENGTH=496 /DNA_ID=CAMNT_0038958121 /DNA_START=142 /DNA_END=1629 /DNA_ORIENTATION=-
MMEGSVVVIMLMIMASTTAFLLPQRVKINSYVPIMVKKDQEENNGTKRESWSERRRRDLLFREKAMDNFESFMVPKDSRLQVTKDEQDNDEQRLPHRRRRPKIYDMDDEGYRTRRRPRRKFPTRLGLSLRSIGRVLLPSFIACFFGVYYYDNLATFINQNWLDDSSIQFLSSDEIQFIPSFLTVISLLFSILAGNAFSSLYNQQETIYFALYREVSEAKSLLEQMTLVCSGRPFYKNALKAMKTYISTDLRRVDIAPADLIAQSPAQDPLEAIMYLTSVGVPSVIYETVRDLRQARGYRLGAMQRKFPRLGIVLLWVLAILELAAFPLLGAGVAGVGNASVFQIQGALFGGLCGATTLVLRIIQELWRTSGGTFNVDPILNKMVKGLTEELDMRAKESNGINSNMMVDGEGILRSRYTPKVPKNISEGYPGALNNGINGTDDEEASIKIQKLLSRVEELEAKLGENSDDDYDEYYDDDDDYVHDDMIPKRRFRRMW